MQGTVSAAVAALFMLGMADACAVDQDYPISFRCGEGAQRFSILLGADANALLVLDGLADAPSCQLHLEEIEGEPGGREPGNKVQFDFLRTTCSTPALQAQSAREVFVHYYDFWKPEARPLAMYQRGGYPVACDRPVIDWTLVETLDKGAG